MSKSFLIGAATSAHQVEGNNLCSDAWAMEQMAHSAYAEPSGDCMDHYNRYREDIALMAKAGLNAYRFSIEWARIEPEEGQFCQAEIDHYRDVLLCCRDNGITPIVTMHHFSSPVWVIRKGGWEAESTIEYFARYCAYIAKELGEQLEYVCTINEANMGIQIAAMAKQMQKNFLQIGLDLSALQERAAITAKENLAVFGTEDPQVFLSPRTEKGNAIICRAHALARNAMKAQCPWLKIGMTLSLYDIQALPGGQAAADELWQDEFAQFLPAMEQDDFVGVQCYTRTVVDAKGPVAPAADAPKTQMGYENYPQALENVIRRVHAETGRTILVTENGIAADDDSQRQHYIRRALDGVARCKAEGIPVAGYCYWSLLDNFEWQKGFSMTFGLVAVDRTTQQRHPKDSLWLLGRCLWAMTEE